MTSFIQQFSGQEDTLRPVLEHFVGPLPRVEVVVPKLADRDAAPADHWLRAGGTRHSAHQSPAAHLAAAREHLAIFLHLTRVDELGPTINEQRAAQGLPPATEADLAYVRAQELEQFGEARS